MTASDLRRHAPLLTLLGVYAASRAFFHALGLRFDTRELADSVQHVDPVLLRTDLLSSVYHLHGQPPLWNLVLGAVLKLFPESWPTAFHALHLVLGAVVAGALYLLLDALRVGRVAGAVVAGAIAVAPATVLYEKVLFYDHATMVVLTVAALACARYVSRPTVGRGVVFFSLLAALVLMRTLFQLPWILLVIALLLLLRVAPWRSLVAAAAVPVAVVALVHAKNLVEFETPTTSSWFGMGLARVTRFGLEDAELRTLAARRDISRVSLVPPLSPLPAYRRALDLPPPTGVAVLDQRLKRGGFPNLHHLAFVEISRRYGDDNRYLLRHRPRAYLAGVERGVQLFFWPPTQAGRFDANREHLGRWPDLWNAVVYGSTPYANRAGFVVGAAYVAAFLVGLLLAIGAWRGRAGAASPTLLFIWLTMLYVSIGGNLTEVGENYRFRYVLDPVVVALLAAAVAARIRRARTSGQVART